MSEHAVGSPRTDASSEEMRSDSSTNLPVTLSEERKQALLSSWRDVLAGKAQPEVLPIPPEVEEAVRSEERRLPGRLSASAKKRLLEDYALSLYYGGRPVVCLDSPPGCAVLAVGDAELLFFMESIPLEQRRRVQTIYPGPWEQEEAE